MLHKTSWLQNGASDETVPCQPTPGARRNGHLRPAAKDNNKEPVHCCHNGAVYETSLGKPVIKSHFDTGCVDLVLSLSPILRDSHPSGHRQWPTVREKCL